MLKAPDYGEILAHVWKKHPTTSASLHVPDAALPSKGLGQERVWDHGWVIKR